jgi:hypothetical protein
MVKRLLVLLCAAALFSGCLSVEKTTIKPVAIGMSMKQVKKNLGPPDEVSARRESQTWEYEFTVPCSGCSDGLREKTARLKFDEYKTLSQINDLPGRYIKP